MGSDTNIIAASASALADSLEYAIWKAGSELRRRDERHFTTAPDATRPPTRRPPRRHRDPTEVTDDERRPARREATLHLARWTVTSGSNAQSRGAVVIAAGDHEWRASAEGNGAIDALYRAVDKALAGVLDRASAAARLRHPRARRGDRHDRRGQRPDRAAGRRPASAGTRRVPRARRAARTSSPPRSRPTSWPSTRCSPRRTGPGATEAAGSRRRVPVSAGTAREQRADDRRGRGPARHDGLVRAVSRRGRSRPLDSATWPCTYRSPTPASPAPSPRTPCWPPSATSSGSPLGSFREVFEAVAARPGRGRRGADRERHQRHGPRELRPAARARPADRRRGRRARPALPGRAARPAARRHRARLLAHPGARPGGGRSCAPGPGSC